MTAPLPERAPSMPADARLAHPKQVKYYPHLDSLRGLAALIVCLYHVNWVNHLTMNPFIGYGSIFVDFFFVLSGIVISHVYPHIRNGRDYKSFLKKRFARLYPLHFATLIVLAVAFLGVQHFFPAVWQKIGDLPQMHDLGFKFLLNLFLLNAHSLTSSNGYNVPSWSIGAEVTCYFLFGAICVFFYSRRIAVYLVLVAASLAMLIPLGKNIVFFQYEWGFVRGIAGFFIGCIVYHLKTRPGASAEPSGTPAIAIMLAATLLLVGFNRHLPVWASFGFPAIFGALLYLLMEPPGFVMRLLCWRPLLLLGTLSYSIYMLHFLIRWAIGFVLIKGFHAGYGHSELKIPALTGDVFVAIYVAVLIVTAWLSYRFYEDPLRRWLR